MAPTALMLAGIGVSAGAQIMGGRAAAAEGKSEAAMANYNADVMEQQAKATEQKTAFEQQRESEAARRRQSSLEASLAATGAISTEGSPLLIKAKQASEDELTNLMIGYEGATEASRARNAATGYRMEATAAKSRGKSRALGAYMGAGGTLLTGFGKMDWGR
jgi:hypothetical protein